MKSNGNRLAYSTQTPAPPVKGPVYCEHGRDAGQVCYPCDVGEEDAEMERELWFGTPENPIL